MFFYKVWEIEKEDDHVVLFRSVCLAHIDMYGIEPTVQ